MRPCTSLGERAAQAASDCTPLPYQPCDQDLPAPFTDGKACVQAHADYDRNRANGCEAAPDDIHGASLVSVLQGTIVPAAETSSQ